jgi:hypothetical protein
MHNISRPVIRLSLVLLLICSMFGVSAFAQGNARERHITGVVVALDRAARTMSVRENNGKTTTIRVPEKRLLHLLGSQSTTINFEYLQRGMIISDSVAG